MQEKLKTLLYAMQEKTLYPKKPQLIMAREPQDFDAERLEGFAANIYRVILTRNLKGFMRKRLRVIYYKQLWFLVT